MATLIAYQDGNWTGATTWKAVATGTNAAMTTTSASTNTTTSYVDSSAFTVTNTEVLEGLLLYCVRVNTTGTVSVALSDDNGTTATREVTVNASDLPASASWVFFKFGSTLTADGGSDYKVKVKGSSAGNATFFRDGTAGNWARIIRKSDTASIATTDVVYICDELTGAGTKNDITVTMDSTATTSYGSVFVGQGGVLSYGTSASTNYYLKLAGNLIVGGGGTLNIGTSGTRMPSTSTASLEFSVSSNVQFGLTIGNAGTCNIYGATKSNTKVLLTANAASGQKVVTVEATNGWLVGDEIVLATTTTNAAQTEKRTLSTIDSATQATVTTNLSATHDGVAPYQGEVVNITRNVKIFGTSGSLQSYIYIAPTASFTAEYAEFYWLGGGGGGASGIYFDTAAAGVGVLKFCSLHDFNLASSELQLWGTTGSCVIEDNVITFPGGGGNNADGMEIQGTTGSHRIVGNWFLAASANGRAIRGGDYGSVYEDLRFCGFFAGFELTEGSGGTTPLPIGSVKNITVHSITSNNNSGIFLSGYGIGTATNLTTWRNAGTGITCFNPIVIDTCSSYHNQTSNLSIGGGVIVRNSTFNGGTGGGLSAAPRHISLSSGESRFENCNFGQTNQATALMALNSGIAYYKPTFINCNIAESLTPPTQTNLLAATTFSSAICHERLNQTSGSHRAYKAYGYTASDQSTYRTAAPSEALIPNNASNKLPSGSKKFAVANGGARTVTVYVNKSATYNGNQPRLIVKRNIVGGITTDTVLATASGGTGSWLTLTGTTATVTDDCVLEVYVDCDGTAGTVYVDDWSVS